MFKHYITYLLLLVNLFLVVDLAAQSYLYHLESFSVDEGLSNRFVYSIAQDKKGFMWFGTKYGLNRYDGYSFQVLTKEKNGLQSNLVRHVLTPNNNPLLWVGYFTNTLERKGYGGIDLINPNTFEVTSIEDFFGSSLPFEVTDVINLYTFDGTLYLTTQEGKIYTYLGDKNLKLLYEDTQQAPINHLTIGESYIWLHCGNQLRAINQQDWHVLTSSEFTLGKSLHISFVQEQSPHRICLEVNNWYDSELFIVWDIQTNSLVYLDSLSWLDKLPVGKSNHTLTKYRQHQAWLFKSRKALVLLDSTNQPLFTKTYPIKDPVSITQSFQDRQGNIWLAITTKGITKISIKENKFETIFEGLSGRGIIGIRNDSFLIYNSYGDYQMEYDIYKKTARNIGFHGIVMTPSIDGEYIWMSGETPEIIKINKKDLSDRIAIMERSLDSNITTKYTRKKLSWTIYQDSLGVVWVGNPNGMSYLAPTDSFVRPFINSGKFKSFSSAIVNFLYENEQGIWIASSKGLFLLDNKHKLEITRHIDAAILPHENILHIHQSTKDILWLSTKGGGIIRLNLSDNTTKQYTTLQGLPHNIVYNIQEDKYGYFWMTTDFGLVRYDRTTEQFRVFLPEDGIPHEEFNHTSFYKAIDGKLYFGGINGVVGFDPSDFLEEKKTKNPIQIVSYQYFDAQVGKLIDNTQQLLQQEAITLQHTDKFFILEFSTLDFLGERNSSYAYKIEGLDEAWTYVNTNNIRINNLPSGSYTLLVKEGNHTTNTEVLQLPILIKLPFYLTGVFWSIVVLFLITSIIIYAKWRELKLTKTQLLLEKKVTERTQLIAEQAEELKELGEIKSRFFANISHELRTPLTLMIGPVSAILEKHYGNDWGKISQVLEVVQRNGSRLQGLIEEILLLSKLDEKEIQLFLEPTLLLSYLEQLLLGFEAQAHLKNIQLLFEFELEENLYLELDTSQLDKIIINLLSNALKHTPSEGKIILKAEKIDLENSSMLQITVKDSGKGIHEKDLPYIFNRFYQSKDKSNTLQGGTGIGLSLVAELTDLYGGNVKVNSILGEGSIFCVQIPFRETPPVEADSTTILTTPPFAKVALADSPTEESKEKPLLLIVEDNTDMIAFLVDLLQSEYRIQTAINGQLALDYLNQTTILPDLILSDIMMPVLDGFELLAAVKKHTQWFKIPMILLTARANEQDKINALRVGVDDYLKKPFSSPELFARIKNLIHNYHQRQSWQKEVIQDAKMDTPPILSESTSLPETTHDNWLQEIETILKKQVGNTQFGIVELAADLHLSERQLRRKIKTKTGLTPNQYFRCIKLDVARQYLEQKKYETIAEVAHKVGFSNTHYFSKIYQEQYGKKPINYLKN